MEKAGVIVLHLKPIDDQARAGIEVSAAEQSVKHIETLIERTEHREEAIGTFMNVADGIIAVVDNIAVYAVEYGLVQKLEGFFSPSRVMKMSPDLIQAIAAEPPGAASQREQLSRKLEVLKTGIETCRKYISSREKCKIPYISF